MRQHGLAGARFTLDQQRSAEQHGGIDRHFQIVGGDVILGAFETLHLHKILSAEPEISG